MPVKAVSIDLVRRRMPQVLKRVMAQPPRPPFRWPRGRLGAAAGSLHWVSWRMVGGAVLLAGIVHICATFVAAVPVTGHAYQLLAEKLPVNRMVALPVQAPGRQILPYLPPDMLYAMCRYDLSAGPVTVTATVLDAGWALSLHTPQGGNFYVLPGQAQRRTNVSFAVVPSAPDMVPLVRRESAADTQIASPTMEGLVVLRGPLRGRAWAAEIEAVLRAASCTLVK
jgi:uncharacterized membrane protein